MRHLKKTVIILILTAISFFTSGQLRSPSTVVYKDANANTAINNSIDGYTTTATAAGTTTLTVSSTHLQYFTGVTTQTVTLPVASTLALGHSFEIDNASTGAVTVNSSGGNAVVIVAAGTSAIVTCILTSGTTAASWSYWYGGVSVVSAKKLTVNNNISLTATDGETINVSTPTAGKVLVGDGTNMVLSTPTFPNASATAGKMIVSDGTNWVASTPTFPNASATSAKVIKSDGTNWVASTETYAAPSTSGNIMTSDGTNWTSATNNGGWITLRVSGSNATTTGQSLIDITGLVSGTLTNSATYEIEAVLSVSTSNVTTGTQYGIGAGGSGGAAVVEAILTGTTTTNAVAQTTENAASTAQGTFLTTSSTAGLIIIKGFVTTRGSGTATISIQHLKVTSGTSTVLIGSVFRYRIAQ